MSSKQAGATALAGNNPHTLSQRLDDIPQDLRAFPQWVNWHYVANPNGPKPRKVPLDPKTGRPASVSDATTWGSFEAAAAVCGRSPAIGIGFVLTAADPFFGIDLDACIDPSAGTFTDPLATVTVRRFASYTEPSPSGTGLHIIGRGRLPPGGRRKGRVEMYDSARYLTFTGRPLSGFQTVADRDAELARFHGEIFGQTAPAEEVGSAPLCTAPPVADEVLLAKAKSAANGERFTALWEGKWQALGYPSQSEADLALCSKLAFWTDGRADWVDKLFRQSALIRPKWDEGHYSDGATYGARVVQLATTGCRDRYTWPTATPTAVSAAGNGDDPLQAEIMALARLPAAEYDRTRKHVADRLGIRVITLDKLVAAEHVGEDDDGLAGRALDLPSPEPWPEAVSGADILDAIGAHFRRFAALPGGAAEALALWTMHAHVLEASPISPRLVLTSPEKRCGKTTVLRVLAGLVPKPLPTSNITPAALFRTIEVARPTLLVDEADTFAKDNEELRGILNSGHARDGNVVRLVGDDHSPRQFATWCPTVLASIGRLAGTIEDRAVIIPMRRRLRGERIERLRLDRPQGEVLARKAARWGADHVAALADSDPEIPALLNDRAADNWRPLLAIADMAGGEWPAKARHAALTLSGEAVDTEPSIRTQLLCDIREAFNGAAKDRLTTDDLLGRLMLMRDHPWADWSHGRALTARQLAKLLADFRVSPSTIRVGEVTAKGYQLEHFTDAFARYLAV